MFAHDDWEPGRMMDGYGGNSMMDNGGWFLIAVGLMFLLIVGFMLMWTIKGTVGPSNSDRAVVQPGGAAREALDLRLARGEVGVEEYERLRTLLGP